MGFGFEDLFEYGGSSISSEKGNIRQPDVIEGDFRDVRPVTLLNEGMSSGEAEVEEYVKLGLEGYNRGNLDLFKGLENLVLDKENRIFYMDDHQHALTGWLSAFEEGLLEGDTLLLHADRHDDFQKPDPFQPPEDIGGAEKVIADNLDNDEFIYPACQWGIVDDVRYWGIDGDTGTEIFMDDFDHESIIMDLDLDVFRGITSSLAIDARDPESSFGIEDYEVQMNYFYDGIAEFIAGSDFATIATSPGYIYQDSALMHLEEVMDRYEDKKGELGGSESQFKVYPRA